MVRPSREELPMTARKRIERYRNSGGAADLVRVEVLVPEQARREVIELAARLRSAHRENKALRELCDRAQAMYGAHVRDNIDLDRLPDLRSRAAVLAKALIDRGDARAFYLGRRILAQLES
jgi:hypothetical protein